MTIQHFFLILYSIICLTAITLGMYWEHKAINMTKTHKCENGVFTDPIAEKKKPMSVLEYSCSCLFWLRCTSSVFGAFYSL